MKKKTYLMVGLFLAATLAVGSFSAVTLAWIVRTSAIDGIRIDASSLNVNLVSQNLYKYVFPRYKDSSGNDTNIVDYLSEGEVKTVSNDANMNPLDPTYLSIQRLLSQEGIGVLNTNLVLEFEFEITYTTSIDFYVFAERDYQGTFLKSTPTSQRVSDFIHFDYFRDNQIADYLDENLESQHFTGNGRETVFNLTSAPSGIHSVIVGGEETDDYTLSGKAITFDTPPVDHAAITVNYSTVWHAVKYAAEHKASSSGSKTDNFVADGTTSKYMLSYRPTAITSVTVGEVELAMNEYNYIGQELTLTSVPSADTEIEITYDHSITHDVFPYKEDKMVMADYHLEPNRPDKETTSRYKFYLNIEYDYDLVSSDSIFNFFDPRYLGDTFALDRDYRLAFGVKQGAK